MRRGCMPIDGKKHERRKRKCRYKDDAADGERGAVLHTYWGCACKCLVHLGAEAEQFTFALKTTSPYLSRTNSPPMPGMWKLNTKHLVGPRGLLMHPWWLGMGWGLLLAQIVVSKVLSWLSLFECRPFRSLDINWFFFWVLFYFLS